jgi:hypothetical protein
MSNSRLKIPGNKFLVLDLHPMYTSHYVMLSRNLFYTGLTRAKKLALIVGSEKAVAIAIRQVKQQQRYTLHTIWMASGLENRSTAENVVGVRFLQLPPENVARLLEQMTFSIFS